MVWSLDDFLDPAMVVGEHPPTYWYEGLCPRTQQQLALPRTALSEAIARGLMQQLAQDATLAQEGKMFGVLLVATASGEVKVLKAFSGLLKGQRVVAGWVPPIPGRDAIAAAEASTLQQLEHIKHRLLTLQHSPVRSQLSNLTQHFEQRLRDLAQHHAQRKQARQTQRQQLLATETEPALSLALAALETQSRHDGMERRRLKRDRDQALHPYQQQVTALEDEIRALKQQRKEHSRQLQSLMHRTYRLMNFAGEAASLADLVYNRAFPTGTGDCCAPKLLHYAAAEGLKPLAMAEFWWGPPPPTGDKQSGEFYGACVERCQPILGFLLSGLQPAAQAALADQLPILYQDDWLLVVNKPAGLLSVPGRDRNHQDSVVSRLQLAQAQAPLAVHRLDQDTSGILLLARDRETHRQLNQQFQQRQVHKVYEAVLTGVVIPDQGLIELPLCADLADRPRQKVDWQTGNPSTTKFRVLARTAATTRIEFHPLTGRTHQLRVHAAHPDGLGAPILGDRLYGHPSPPQRLHLHARQLALHHPHTGQWLEWNAPTPF